MNNFNKFQSFILVLSVIFLGILGYFVYSFFSSGSDIQSAETIVKYDKVAIIEKVQSQNKLQTASQTIQRDVNITLDLGEFQIFGLTILENQKTQTVAITGEVVAGLDLSKIDESDIIIDQDKKTLTIILPESEIFGVNILEDKTRVLREDATQLFNLKTSISSDLRRDVNDTFQRQVIKQAKLSLTDASCQNGILVQANENGNENLENLFQNFEFEEVIIQTNNPQECFFAD